MDVIGRVEPGVETEDEVRNRSREGPGMREIRYWNYCTPSPAAARRPGKSVPDIFNRLRNQWGQTRLIFQKAINKINRV